MADKQNDEYQSVTFYKKAAADRQRGFVKFSDGDSHYFTYLSGGDVVFRSQAYTSIAGRDNGIESVRKNMKTESRYRFSENAGKHEFGLFAGNGQEIAISPTFSSAKAARAMAARASGKASAPVKAKATTAKKAGVKKPAVKKSVSKTDGRVENYKPLAFYQARSGKIKDGFGSFSEDGAHFFTYNKNGKIVLLSESYTSKSGRDNGIVSVKKNMPIKERYEHHRHKNGKYYFDLNAGNHQEIATSVWYGTSAAALAGAAALRGEVTAKPAKVTAAKLKTAKTKKANTEDNYHPLAFYEKNGNAVKNGFDTFDHNGSHYFTYNRAGKIVLISESYPTKGARDTGRASVEKNMKLEKRYDYRTLKNGKYDYRLKAGNGKEIARSVWYGSAAAATTGAAYLLGKRKQAAPKPRKPKPKVAPIAAAAPVIAAAAVAAKPAAPKEKAAPVVTAPVAAAPIAAAGLAAATVIPAATTSAAAPAATAAGGAGIWGWLKWLLLGLLALLALLLLSKCFGGADKVAKPIAAPAVTLVSCWDGSEAKSEATCPTKITCWDGSFVASAANCPVEPAPEPVEVVTPEPAPEPVTEVVTPEPVRAVMGSIDRVCGPSNITLFDVPNYMTPKSVTYLGSNPEFGDSHGLTPSQFYDKLAARYSAGGIDRAFLNYTARALGYSGFSAMDASMFSEDVLARGEKGLLGFSEYHALQYSVLNTNDRDRQAFRVRAASGQDIHFMKSCGNFMYVCQ